MTTSEIFSFLRDEIHTTIFATTNDKGLPVTCVIDIMLAKGERLYFLTARGKSFYKRLMDNGYVAFSGLKGEDTLSSVSVSVRAHVKDVGDGLIEEIFEANDYMKQIYASSESRKALTVFEVYKGEGEYFDLSSQPIERYSFTFGGEEARAHESYHINSNCVGCGACQQVCPTACITAGKPFVIASANCLHCGNCYEACKFESVEKNI